jgi:CPA1 family monovalent cation:H+ antiporter
MLVVWAGMRGVVTLAAAQTLPPDTPSRSLLVLIAFFVAAASLLIQGGTIAAVARRLGLTGLGTDADERQRLSDDLGAVVAKIIAESGGDTRALLRRNEDDEGSDVPTPSADFDLIRPLRMKMIHAQRQRLLELQKDGVYSSASLTWALQSLDADEISLELRATDAGD